MKRPWQPKKKKGRKMCGFRAYSKRKYAVLVARRKKGRLKLTRYHLPFL
ncbi:MAG: 50S ribosomal protein L34 [Candidatus Moeniiplasma glomeromycotorum]|nr:50S ribosomal protein L34 [Candidatus Moeniiplasma glomeromycotorum]MCE8168197.1 50S ribosomal protein L34 [Candidatus Moeniiplasma glomeromycotorum]MCE8169782.1 50S ribosomal protein L34 [Candidatus Moeniiplasma glomeromycotorum]